MTVKITRLDYKNPVIYAYGPGFKQLPDLDSVKDITDINEVRSVSIFADEKDLDFYLSKFPKYMKVRKGSFSDGQNITGRFLYKQFNTFFHDGTTGEKNETAIKHREKFIDILKDLY